VAQPELGLEPDQHLWRDLKIDVQRLSPSNLTELERICREEWENLPKYSCAKLVTSYPRRLEAVTAAKGALSTEVHKVLSKMSQYLWKCDISFFFIHLLKF
jgi:hypothetical protein